MYNKLTRGERNMPFNKRLLGLLAGSIFYGLSASVAHAVMINEVSPDAGELLGTAQDTTGTGAVLESISGSLIDLGSATPIDDVDLFKILITNPAAFSVTVTASLSDDNDAQLYLFDAAGIEVLYSDDGGVGFLPQFDAGDLIDPAGEYFLAFNLFATAPETVGNLDTGWDHDPAPFQTGPYTLSLTGVETAGAAVPEPSTLALLSLGLAGFGFMRRKMKS